MTTGRVRRLVDLTGRLATPERLTLFGWALVASIAVAFAIVVFSADGTSVVAGGRLGGDWAPFHAAGVLWRQDPQLLLDVDAQERLIAPLFEGAAGADGGVAEDGGWLPFANPPIFGALLLPFGFLSFRAGYVVFVLLLVLAAVVAVRWTMDVLGVTDPRWRRVGLLGALTFGPTFKSYAGAQNATISLLILAGAMHRLQRGHEWSAGAILGLLWFKPQFAVPAIGLLAVARHLRAAAAATLIGVALWAASAVVFGLGWVGEWASGILRVTDEGNRLVNLDISVSAVEWLRGTIGGTAGGTGGSTAGDVVGIGLAAVIGLGFVVLVHRRRDAASLLVATSAALLLTALHAMHYELTLLVPALGAILATRRGLVTSAGAALPVVLALWAVSPVMILGVHPVVRIAYVVAVTALWLQASRAGDVREDGIHPASFPRAGAVGEVAGQVVT